MEENEEKIKEDIEQTAEELIRGKEPLEIAEYYISWKRIDEAQRVLDTISVRSGKKYYLQSRIYKAKFWYNEQRKALKAAIKAEPDNEQYKKELEELKEFSKTTEYKSTVRKQQMGACESVCTEGGAECCCICICEGLGEAICNGC